MKKKNAFQNSNHINNQLSNISIQGSVNINTLTVKSDEKITAIILNSLSPWLHNEWWWSNCLCISWYIHWWDSSHAWQHISHWWLYSLYNFKSALISKRSQGPLCVRVSRPLKCASVKRALTSLPTWNQTDYLCIQVKDFLFSAGILSNLKRLSQEPLNKY